MLLKPKIAITPGNANNLTCNFGLYQIRAEDWQFLPYRGCLQLVGEMIDNLEY